MHVCFNTVLYEATHSNVYSTRVLMFFMSLASNYCVECYGCHIWEDLSDLWGRKDIFFINHCDWNRWEFHFIKFKRIFLLQILFNPSNLCRIFKLISSTNNIPFSWILRTNSENISSLKLAFGALHTGTVAVVSLEKQRWYIVDTDLTASCFIGWHNLYNNGNFTQNHTDHYFSLWRRITVIFYDIGRFIEN